MAMQVGGSNRGIQAEMNVVPLIDILLVLLVIFMIIPTHQKGLDTLVPQAPTKTERPIDPGVVIVVQVDGSGGLRIAKERIR